MDWRKPGFSYRSKGGVRGHSRAFHNGIPTWDRGFNRGQHRNASERSRFYARRRPVQFGSVELGNIKRKQKETGTHVDNRFIKVTREP